MLEAPQAGAGQGVVAGPADLYVGPAAADKDVVIRTAVEVVEGVAVEDPVAPPAAEDDAAWPAEPQPGLGTGDATPLRPRAG